MGGLGSGQRMLEKITLRKFLRLILPLALVVACIGIVLGLVAINKGKRPERRDDSPPALLVDVIPVAIESLKLSVRSQGTVRPRTETTLAAEVSGMIVSVAANFIAGGFLRKDAELLQIDPSDYATAQKRAQANLASRQAQYADQNARSEQALKDWRNLGRAGEPSDLTLRKPQLAEALAAVQAAEADLQKAERDLARTRISIPYDGLVRSRSVDIGQYVSPGTPLGITFAVESAEVRLPIAIQDLAYLNLPSATGEAGARQAATRGPRVKLTARGSGIQGEWQAEIIRTEGVIDEASRVVYAVAEVRDPYAILGQGQQLPLRIGTFVSAEIEGIQADNVAVLPRSLVRPDDTLLIAADDNRLEIRRVEVLRAEPTSIYLSSGVANGERVISTSLDAPIAGTLLNVVAQPSGQASGAERSP